MASLFPKLATPHPDIASIIKSLQEMRSIEELARNKTAASVLGQIVALISHLGVNAKSAAKKASKPDFTKRVKGDAVSGSAGEHSFEAVIGKVGGKPVVSRIMVWKGEAKPGNLVADFSKGAMLKGEADPLSALLAEFSKQYPQLSAPLSKQGEEEDAEMAEDEAGEAAEGEVEEGEAASDGDTIHAVIFALAEMLATAGDPLATQVLAAYDPGEGEEAAEEEAEEMPGEEAAELEGQDDEAADGELEEEPRKAARATMHKGLRVRLTTEINDEGGETGVVIDAGTVVDVESGRPGGELLIRVPDSDDVLPVQPDEYEIVKAARATMRKALVSGGYAAAKYLVDATGAIQKAQMQISGEDMPPEINQDLETARTAIQAARTSILAQVDARKGARPQTRKGADMTRSILRGTVRMAKAQAAITEGQSGKRDGKSNYKLVQRLNRKEVVLDEGNGPELFVARPDGVSGFAVVIDGTPYEFVSQYKKAARATMRKARNANSQVLALKDKYGNPKTFTIAAKPDGDGTFTVSATLKEFNHAYEGATNTQVLGVEKSGIAAAMKELADEVTQQVASGEWTTNEEDDAGEKKIKRGTLTVTHSGHGSMIYGTNLNGDEVFLAQAGDGGDEDYMADEGYDPNEEAETLAEAYGFELVDTKAARAQMKKLMNEREARYNMEQFISDNPDLDGNPKAIVAGFMAKYPDEDWNAEDEAWLLRMARGISTKAARPATRKAARPARRPIKKADDSGEFNDDGYYKDGETVVIDPDADMDDVAYALVMEGWEDERADEVSDMGWSYSLVIADFRVGDDEYGGFIYAENKNSGNKDVSWLDSADEAREKWEEVEADVASEDAAIITEPANGVAKKFRAWFADNPGKEPQDAVDDLQYKIGDDLGTGTSDGVVAAMLEVAQEVYDELDHGDDEGGDDIEAAARIGSLRKAAATEPNPAARQAYEAEIARLEDGVSVQKSGGPDVRVRKFSGFAVGDDVLHKSFGKGRIMALETGQSGKQVSVIFSDPDKGNILGPMNIDPNKLKRGK